MSTSLTHIIFANLVIARNDTGTDTTIECIDVYTNKSDNSKHCGVEWLIEENNNIPNVKVYEGRQGKGDD